MKLGCRLMGHRWHFWREGRTVNWGCARGCEHAGGAREYGDEREARRYLGHFGQEPQPPLGLLAALSGTVDRGRHRSGEPECRGHPPASS